MGVDSARVRFLLWTLSSKLEQGCHEELSRAELITLRNMVRSLQNSSSSLHIMLEWEDVRPQYVVNKENARRKLPPEKYRPSCYILG